MQPKWRTDPSHTSVDRVKAALYIVLDHIVSRKSTTHIYELGITLKEAIPREKYYIIFQYLTYENIYIS
jgi:hypothetical protein